MVDFDDTITRYILWGCCCASGRFRFPMVIFVITTDNFHAFKSFIIWGMFTGHKQDSVVAPSIKLTQTQGVSVKQYISLFAFYFITSRTHYAVKLPETSGSLETIQLLKQFSKRVHKSVICTVHVCVCVFQSDCICTLNAKPLHLIISVAKLVLSLISLFWVNWGFNSF